MLTIKDYTDNGFVHYASGELSLRDLVAYPHNLSEIRKINKNSFVLDRWNCQDLNTLKIIVEYE